MRSRNVAVFRRWWRSRHGQDNSPFRLLESLQESARTAFLFQAGQDSRDFLDSLVRDLGIAAKSTDLPALHDALNTMLVKEMEENRRVVVVIDEAQNLTEQMLEQVRLLSNFETPAAKIYTSSWPDNQGLRTNWQVQA